MLLFIIFCPIIAAIAILAGAPARKTALLASVFTFVVTLLAFALFDKSRGGFQDVHSFTISTD